MLYLLPPGQVLTGVWDCSIHLQPYPFPHQTACLEHLDWGGGACLCDVDLGSFAVVLELARELGVLELVQHLRHARGRLGQHGLDGHARHEVHMLVDLLRRRPHIIGNSACENCPGTAQTAPANTHSQHGDRQGKEAPMSALLACRAL